MDSGEVAALVALVGGILTAFGAGDLVPFIGPAINGVFAIGTLVAAVYSFYSHRQKTAAMVAAGIRK